MGTNTQSTQGVKTQEESGLRLAFYRGAGNWFDKITRWRTNGTHSHVELVFPDGLSFSSSQWDGGCRFKQITYNPPGEEAKWDLVEVPGYSRNGLALGMILDYCNRQDGKGYDWRSLLRIFAGTGNKDTPEQQQTMFCSEVCLRALQSVGRLKEMNPAQTTPEALFIAALALEEGYLDGWDDGLSSVYGSVRRGV